MADGFFPMDFTADGVLFYAQDAGGGDLHSAPFDLSTLRAGEPSKLVHAHQGYNGAAYWSANGTTLTYASRRSALSIGQTARLIVRDVASGNERVVANGPILHRKFSRPQPSADGRQIAVWSDDNRGRRGIHLVETATGNYRQLVRFDDEVFEDLGNPQWSRDGRAIIYPARLRQPARFVLIRQDIATGEKKELLSNIQPLGGWVRMLTAVSPDERSVAYAGVNRDTLRVRIMALDGGPTRDLVTMKISDGNAPRWTGLTWTPDGKHVLFGVPQERAPEEVELLAVPVAGGAPRSTGLVVRELRHVSLTPDGRLSFTSGRQDHKQVWTMENIFARLGRGN
jgi:Tol biopolymer transport system component